MVERRLMCWHTTLFLVLSPVYGLEVMMHIADIRTIPLSYTCAVPYGSAAGMQTRRNALVVEIETDNGLVGIGEAGSAGFSSP